MEKLTGTAGDSDGPAEETQAIEQADGVDQAVLDQAVLDEAGEPTVSAGRFGGRSGGRIAAVLAGAVLAVLAVVYVIDLLSTSGELERNTTIAGVAVGGLTPEQASAALTEQAAPGYAEQLTVDVHGEPASLDPAVAGLTPDVAGTIENAGQRSANPIVRLTSFFRSPELPLSVQVDEAALGVFLGTVAAQTDLAPVEGAVSIDGAAVRAVDPVIGRNLQVPEAARAVSTAWAAGGPGALNGLVLPVTATPVRASPEQVQAATTEVNTILSAPLKITGAGAVIEVPVADIAAATTVAPDGADGFTVGVDSERLRLPFMDAINATAAPPADARISIENDAPVIVPSAPGRTVDLTATDAAIGPALRSPGRAAPIAYVLADPSLTTEKAQALGIKEIIGEFTTGGFAAASGENIRVVAEKVNGAVIAPGATFGLNEFTGTRGAAEGYVEAAIIQEGALSTAVGGGISQFATTLYNAAYFAGMGDVTHTPHSFYISRYPPGREATVFDGEIELAFSNDYPTGVLIQTRWTDS
ncbi:MAG: VanW family protein, partial [Nakamurella sp.]